MEFLSDVLSTGLSILAVAVGLGFVIFVHELGHFLVAKWVGVLVQRFSIGFGPILWSFRRGETEYAISAIPFGGYVKMLGQDDTRPSELVDEELKQDPRSYTAQSVPKRMAIISAGVVMNIIFGTLFFVLVFNLGMPYMPAVIGYVEPGGPAWRAGLQRGDRILEIDGEEVFEFETFQQTIMLSHPTERVTLKVARGDERRTFTLSPELEEFAPQIGVERPISLIVAPSRKGEPPVQPGSAASRVEGEQFQGGERITHANGTPVQTYAELAEALARHAGEEVVLTVERAASTGESTPRVADIHLPPQFFRTLGFRLQMGPITAVRTGSPAEAAGLNQGDVIQAVDGSPFDPLRLPDILAGLAGRDVEITVKRQAQGEQMVKLTAHPIDQLGWITPPSFKSPLAVPALGICYQLVPTIADDPDPESPAARAGLRKGDWIHKVIMILPSDAGKKPISQEFLIDDEKPKGPSIAGIFWDLQLNPNLQLAMEVKRGQESFKTEPFAPETDPAWPFPLRGIKLTVPSARLEPQGLVGAITLGWKTTKNTLGSIYLSLRRLIISRTLSPKTLAGPISIAHYGYLMSTDFTKLLKFLALLSINLAVINFLPIPVLDGGHMVFLTWEWIRGKPASERMIVAANYLGLLIILTLALWITWQDISVRVR